MGKKSMMFLLVFSFISALFLSIGYAQVSNELSVTGNVSLRAQQGVVITKVSIIKRVGDTQSSVSNYVGTTFTNSLNLDTIFNSSITYQIEVDNNTYEDYKFIDVLYDSDNLFKMYSNPFIIPTILDKSEIDDSDAISLGDTIKAGTKKNFYVSYHYDTLSPDFKGYVTNDQTSLYGMVNFRFSPIHKIKYENIIGEYPNEILDGEDLNINFTTLPSRVEITDLVGNILEIGQYNNGNLIIEKVYSSMIVKVYYD